MIIAGEIEIPDECPIGCPGNRGPFSQGGLCSRCPIFNCRAVVVPKEYADEDGLFRIIHPDHYRKDWARIWAEWFKGDMKDYPELYLCYNKGEVKDAE